MKTIRDLLADGTISPDTEVLGTLQKTADGAIVGAYCKIYTVDPVGFMQGLDVKGLEKCDDSSRPSMNYTPIRLCYSTREAAEKARVA